MTEKINLDFIGYWLQSSARSVPNKLGIYCVYSCKYEPETDTVSLMKLLYIGVAENVQRQILNQLEKGEWMQQLEPNEELCFTYANGVQIPETSGLQVYQKIRDILVQSSNPILAPENSTVANDDNIIISTVGANSMLEKSV